jgi:translocator protein
MKKRVKKDLKINWKVFISCILIVYGVALIGSLLTKIDSWYYSIKPSITPPDIVFPIVWTILFFMIALSIYFSWLASDKKRKKKVIVLFGINLVLNVLWSFFYFKMHNVFGAFIVILLLLISILAIISFTWRFSRKASYLLIPYLIWVSFASILNYMSM